MWYAIRPDRDESSVKPALCSLVAIGVCALVVYQFWHFVHDRISAENSAVRRNWRLERHETITSQHRDSARARIPSSGAGFVHDPDDRASAALLVAVLSCGYAAAVLVGLEWQHLTRAGLNGSVLVQFVARGVFVAAPAAILFQSLALKAVLGVCQVSGSPSEWLSRPPDAMASLPFFLYALGASFSVALFEEFSKMLALLLCSRVGRQTTTASSSHARSWTWQNECCGFRPTLYSPAALAMAGTAIGLGFLIFENAEYAAWETLTVGKLGHPIAILIVGALRIVCNLHWVLGGLSASRLATELCMLDSSSQQPLGHDWNLLCVLLRVICPSVFFHAVWDAAVVSSSLRWQAVGNTPNPTESTNAKPVVLDDSATLGMAVAALVAMASYFVMLLRLLLRIWPTHHSWLADKAGDEVGGLLRVCSDSDGD